MKNCALLLLLASMALLFAGCGSPAPTQAPPTVAPPEAAPTLSAPDTPTSVDVAQPETTQAPESEPVAGPETELGPVQDGRPLIARVNGQPIFLDVYEKQAAQTEQALSEQELIAQGEQGDAQREQIRENVLRGLMEQAIIEQAAIAMQISVSEEELDQSLQATAIQGDVSMEQWLADNNMTEEELRELQRAQLVTSKVIQRISESVPTAAEQVHARHILVIDQARAESLLQRLEAGENFAELAQQESEDFSTASNGGDLGWFPRAAPMMPPSVVEAAFTLQPGEITNVISSEIGFHIIKVEAREDNRPLSPEMLLYTQQHAFETWLAERMAEADIERYDTQ